MRVVEGVADVDDVGAFVDRLGAIGEEHGVAVQAFDARYVVDRAHLERAVALADRAAERGETIARDPAVEILLYAAGRRQIDRALEMGLPEGESPVVVVVHAPGMSGPENPDGGGADDADAAEREAAAAREVAALLSPADTLGAYDEARVTDFFGVGDAERAATTADLSALVRERVALLVVDK